MRNRNRSDTATPTTIATSGGLGSGDDSFDVTDATGWPQPPFIARIGDAYPWEIVLVLVDEPAYPRMPQIVRAEAVDNLVRVVSGEKATVLSGLPKKVHVPRATDRVPRVIAEDEALPWGLVALYAPFLDR